AAALEKELKLPKVNYEVFSDSSQFSYSIDVQSPELCPVYHLHEIEGIAIGPSPQWMQEKLTACGIRPLNNLIDITNYVMLETGQPLHAFDAESISGETVLVREARRGETLLMLDGVEREFSGGETLIADSAGPIAVGGVMGGEYSSITDSTENILLESACFSPQSISRTERTLNIKTEASYRFAREVDKAGLLFALGRASALIKKLCGGKLLKLKKKYSFDELKFSQKVIAADTEKINSLLGTALTGEEIKKYLESINFKIDTGSGGGEFKVTVPSYRNDVSRPVDITEEVARVHGYDRIESALPAVKTGTDYFERKDPLTEGETSLRASGYWETVTHTLADGEKLSGIGPGNASRSFPGEIIRLQNPVSADLDILRPSVLPGLLEVLSYNLNRKSPYHKFYEKGPVFFKKEDKLIEKIHLAYIAGEEDYFIAKNTMETLLDSLKQDYSFEYPSNSFYFKEGRCGSIIIEGKFAGEFGAIKESFAGTSNVSRACSGGYLILEKVNKEKIKAVKFEKWSPYPVASRDLSLICPIELTHKNLYDIIKSRGGQNLKNVRVVDSYTGKKLGPEKKSITYSLEFNSREKTLSSEEVDSLIEDILKGLKKEYGVTLRE
ncbi:MAG: phenylalanine--tRNA ligase subunit beta, partial [Elusimicrobiota bacterium]|nr:phenylalanine--tRNA ligase subunit beta [Elusimicrobiota bacterium]